MNKIYQKMTPRRKNPAKSLLKDLFNKVILRRFYSGTQPCPVKYAGFTLIELLVVVLIVGILAAAAQPYYQTAVDKSRFAPYAALAENIRRAQEVYYMANGTYADDLEMLDVSWPASCRTNNANMVSCSDGVLFNHHRGTDDRLFVILCPGQGKVSWATCSQYTATAYVVLYYAHSSTRPNGSGCSFPASSSRGKRLCKALGY